MCSDRQLRQISHFCGVNIANMLFGNASFHTHIYFSEFSLYLGFIYNFCEFTQLAIRNKGKPLILIGSNFQKCQSEIPVSIYKFTFQNSVSISVSYFDSEYFQFHFSFSRQCVHSKTRKVSSLFVVCDC